MGFTLNNATDDTFLISGFVGFVMLCVGVYYKSNSIVEPEERVDYLEERLNSPYPFRTVINDYGGSKTRRKKYSR